MSSSASLEDREAIRDLIARYCHFVDSHNSEAWASLFTSDGALVVGKSRTEGHEALRAFAEGLRAVYQSQPIRHVAANVVVDVDGDRATSQSYLLVVNAGTPPVLGMSGRYQDTLRRDDGVWRFVERSMESDVPLD